MSVNTEAIRQFLEEECKPEDLACILDDTLYEYSYQIAIDVDAADMSSVADSHTANIWALRRLRNLFAKMGGVRFCNHEA